MCIFYNKGAIANTNTTVTIQATASSSQKDFDEPRKSLEVPKQRSTQNVQPKTAEKRSRNLTMMVITVDVLFLVCNLPNSIVYVFSQYVDTNGNFYKTISIVGNIFLFAAAGSDIFIYYSFNKHYRKNFKKLFRF